MFVKTCKEHVDWRPTAAEFVCDTHILGDYDLIEVVTTDLSLVSHRLPEQLFKPLKVALVDPAGGPANTYICLMYMNIMRPRIWECLKKNMYLFWTLYLFILFIYSFNTTCSSSTRSSRRLILFSLSISISKMYIGLHVKYPLLSYFNDTWTVLTDFRKIRKYQISRKSVQWHPTSSMRTYGQRTDMKKLAVVFRNFAKPLKNHNTDNSCRIFSPRVSGCLSDIDISKPHNVSGTKSLKRILQLKLGARR
jgi:hypothetical protein